MNYYKMNGVTLGRKPKYLMIINWLKEHRNETFSKEDMLIKSGYTDRSYNGYLSDLICALHGSGITKYNPHTREWSIGDRFDIWCNEFLNEDKEQNIEPIFTGVDVVKSNIELVKSLDNDITKSLIESELHSIELSIKKIRELLK